MHAAADPHANEPGEGEDEGDERMGRHAYIRLWHGDGHSAYRHRILEPRLNTSKVDFEFHFSSRTDLPEGKIEDRTQKYHRMANFPTLARLIIR